MVRRRRPNLLGVPAPPQLLPWEVLFSHLFEMCPLQGISSSLTLGILNVDITWHPWHAPPLLPESVVQSLPGSPSPENV